MSALFSQLPRILRPLSRRELFLEARCVYSLKSLREKYVNQGEFEKLF